MRSWATCPGSLTDAFYADPIRQYMIPVFSDRRTDWPSHPHATRDSLHEHDMWVAEGQSVRRSLNTGIMYWRIGSA